MVLIEGWHNIKNGQKNRPKANALGRWNYLPRGPQQMEEGLWKFRMRDYIKQQNYSAIFLNSS